MNKIGQVTLMFFSILVAVHEKISYHDPFFTIELVVFTFIAWIVGLQYDKAKYYEKLARKNEDSYKHFINSLPELMKNKRTI